MNKIKSMGDRWDVIWKENVLYGFKPDLFKTK